ncbi:MAG: amino acid ABC transporter substrate-binding protein [Alphaproteobacteria bacterium]|nr:amino acid ABC transporter substrate-binding protein [Alphaproteobacteria bacterium]
MNKTSVSALVVAAVALVSVFFVQKPQGVAETKKESVYERVLRTGTLRCGYAVWPPFIMKDPNTGVISGAEIDYLNEVGKALNLKVEWTEEVGYGTFIEALNADRIDMMCGVWPNATRAKQADFTRPIEYTAVTAFVRADDTRFDDGFNKLNDPAYIIATIDGEMSTSIAQSDFPNAKTFSLPQLSDLSMTPSNVADGKADITFSDISVGLGYMEKNPGKLKLLHPGNPLRVGANALAAKKGQQDFLSMIDLTTDELLSSGVIERILVKYEKFPGSFYRVSKPFETRLQQR